MVEKTSQETLLKNSFWALHSGQIGCKQKSDESVCRVSGKVRRLSSFWTRGALARHARC